MVFLALFQRLSFFTGSHVTLDQATFSGGLSYHVGSGPFRVALPLLRAPHSTSHSGHLASDDLHWVPRTTLVILCSEKVQFPFCFGDLVNFLRKWIFTLRGELQNSSDLWNATLIFASTLQWSKTKHASKVIASSSCNKPQHLHSSGVTKSTLSELLVLLTKTRTHRGWLILSQGPSDEAEKRFCWTRRRKPVELFRPSSQEKKSFWLWH